MDIGRLQDVRAIILNPVTGGPELQHPDDIDALAASYGPLPCLGLVGIDRTEWSDFGGLKVHESVQLNPVVDCELPEAVQQELCEEYAALRGRAV